MTIVLPKLATKQNRIIKIRFKRTTLNLHSYAHFFNTNLTKNSLFDKIHSMENENIEKQSEDEEISLIDLFAVLVRYRKFIVIFTAACSFLAGIYLFLLPKFAPSLNSKEVLISWTVKARAMPSALVLEGLPKNELISAKSYFSSERLLARENKKFPAFSSESDEMTEKEYNKFIQNIIKNKKLEVPTPIVSLPNEFDVRMTVKEDKTEIACQLFDSMMNSINESLKDGYKSQFETIRDNTKSALDAVLSNDSKSLMTDTQSLNILLQQVTKELAGAEPYVSAPEAPFIYDLSQGRAKKLAIVMFAAFFISVFIAFTRNAIENIKKDPEASKVLKDAWNAGK